MTTIVNKPISLIEDLFKSLVWDPLVTAAIAALDVQAPVLAVWPLSTLINASVDSLSNYIFSQVRLLVDVTAIKLLNDAHQNAFNKAALQLAVIAHEQGVDSDAFLKARAEAKAALSKFINFNK